MPDALPPDARAAFDSGMAARRSGDRAAAVERFRAALAADAGLRAARVELATALRELGRLDEAETEYRLLLDARPGWFFPLLGLGLCARQRKNMPDALARLAAAAAAPPEDRSARLEYAATLRTLGRFDEAAAEYRMLLAAHPGSLPALLGLGACARSQRDLPAAEKQFAAAVAAAPEDRNARHDYATTLRELGRAEAADAEYRILLAASPGWLPALLGLGLCARMRNDRGAALAQFEAAAAAAPDSAAAWQEILTEHADAGRFDAARSVAARLLAQHPALPQAWLGLGRSERAAGNRAAALEAFRQGHAHGPDQPHFLIEMAVEAQALGRFADAEGWLQAAAGHPALAARALTHQGEQARMGQRYEAACDLFRAAAARPEAPVGAHTALAQTLADLGRPEEALAALDAADRQLGARPELAAKRAGLLRRAGFRAEALALARAANAAMPASFPLWWERFENERFSGTLDGIDACLAEAPAAGLRDRARLHHARGLVAEMRWDFAAAAAELRAAVALDGNGATHEALARIGFAQGDLAMVRDHLLASLQANAAVRQLQGLSPNLVHTHLGQILDEYRMDPATLAGVVAANALPADRRLAALLALVRREPDHTPAAIGLLIALRQAGRFAAPAADAEPAGIPARIAQYWDQETPPDDVAALMQSWPARNPAHHYVRFDKTSAAAFLAAHATRDVELAYRRAREPAMKADLFRLAWLFACGGVWADADDRCLLPLADFVPPGADFVAYQEEYGTIGNNFIAVTPFHPVLGLALRLAVQAINRGDDDLLWLATGPGLMSRALVQTLATGCLAVPVWLARMAILQRHELGRGVAVHCAAAYKSTRRYWGRAAFGGAKPASG